jgi:hypothetical protein
MSRVKAAEARLKGISNSSWLAPRLVRRIQIAAVQATALHGAELWWRDQKTHLEDMCHGVVVDCRLSSQTLTLRPVSPKFEITTCRRIATSPHIVNEQSSLKEFCVIKFCICCNLSEFDPIYFGARVWDLCF